MILMAVLLSKPEAVRVRDHVGLSLQVLHASMMLMCEMGGKCGAAALQPSLLQMAASRACTSLPPANPLSLSTSNRKAYKDLSYLETGLRTCCPTTPPIEAQPCSEASFLLSASISAKVTTLEGKPFFKSLPF
jgi:hypothetical protein